MENMELLMGLAVGIGLSAACGFRIFVPLLGLSVAAFTGHVTLASEFEWIGSTPALVAFAVATALEIGAYYVPWIDNLLDTIATPTAVIAGTIMTAMMLGDASPFLKWSLAIIAGGGVAGIIQGGTVSLRGASSTTTGGTGNFLVSTGELIMSILTTLLAILVPVVCLVLVLILCWKMGRAVARAVGRLFRRRQA